jgi:NAD(P)-dependent dehydrogenase (short-subunit alcohol dehydrogenase family)
VSAEVAVVTGGASGIGLALANALGRRGKRILVADRDEVALEAAKAKLAAGGIDATCQVVDVREARDLEELALVAADLGTLSVVCANAGVAASGPNVWVTPASAVDFTFGVNFYGLVHTLKAFVPRLIEAGTPSNVVVTGSMAGLVSLPGSSAYAASKAAAVAVTRSLRAELATVAPHIGVVLLAPGMVGTNLLRTSAAQQGPDMELMVDVETAHAALNEFGATPEQAAQWVLDALDQGQFWALPPFDDMYSQKLTAELTELRAAIT